MIQSASKSRPALRRAAFALAPLLVLVAREARADAGTPLLALTVFHLFIGNFLIGLGEGFLLAKVFKVNPGKAFVAMALANYVSAFAGLWMFNVAMNAIQAHWSGEQFFYLVSPLIAGMAVFSYFASVIIEWPFCLLLTWRKPRRWRTSIFASFIAQTASYLVLVPLYWWASGISFCTQVTHDRSLIPSLTPSAWVYFISPDDHEPYRIRINGAERERLVPPSAGLISAGIANGPDGAAWDKTDISRLDSGGRLNALFWVYFTPEDIELRRAKGDTDETWMSFGLCVDLRAPSDPPWSIKTGFWAAEGLSCWESSSKHGVHVALETPFLQWEARNATLLPGELAVFQLHDQIVVLDLKRRRIGYLVRGVAPVIVLEKEAAADSAPR